MALFPSSMSWKKWREDTATIQRTSIPRILIDLEFVPTLRAELNRSQTDPIDCGLGHPDGCAQCL